MGATIKCIICGSENISRIGGHVHKGDEQVATSFCKEHEGVPTLDNGCRGCYGEWNESMGIDESFGRVFYIDI